MEEHFSRIASLIGDPVRGRILWALMDGKAYTATELAIQADTSRPNLSMHLKKLSDAGLLNVEVQGRHRYYTFSRPEIAYALEAMANLLPANERVRTPPAEKLQPIAYCRHCYDHLAGRVGVQVTESLLRQKLIVHRGKEFEVTAAGVKWFETMGIDCTELQKQRRSFSRVCLDWTERKHHLAGSLGAALLTKMRGSHWLRPGTDARVFIVTGKGQKAMSELFKIELF
ncbi:MAG: transcriptional regulator [Sphingobacteriales bacterium 50-39]|nr:winged helix-turn-helix transcriptional regulator [Sphingobacteriales bacterium]OJW54486.1 MAG: transcriptional regulator [Sphingobacteriales bacterium 50-39]